MQSKNTYTQTQRFLHSFISVSHRVSQQQMIYFRWKAFIPVFLTFLPSRPPLPPSSFGVLPRTLNHQDTTAGLEQDESYGKPAGTHWAPAISCAVSGRIGLIWLKWFIRSSGWKHLSPVQWCSAGFLLIFNEKQRIWFIGGMHPVSLWTQGALHAWRPVFGDHYHSWSRFCKKPLTWTTVYIFKDSSGAYLPVCVCLPFPMLSGVINRYLRWCVKLIHWL